MPWPINKIYFGYDDKYTKTGLMHQYLNFLYHSYVEDCDKEPWIREGILDEVFDPEQYPRLSLAEILQKKKEIPSNCPSTFVLRGSKGDGRVFFFRKMMACCIGHIPSYVTWEEALSADYLFRFPILVSIEDIQRWDVDTNNNPDETILSLLGDCINRQLQVKSKSAISYIRTIVERLLICQKIAVFFDQGICEDEMIANKLVDILYRMENRLLSIFVEDKNYNPGDPNKQHCIDIGPVNVHQIATFLSVMRGESKEKWLTQLKNHPEIVRMLNKPERLLLYVKSQERRSHSTSVEDVVLSNIYNVFVENEISLAVKCAAERNILVSVRELTEWLQNYSENIVNSSDNNYFLFQGTDMFNEDGTFKFEDCKYYLVALKYKLRQNPSVAEIRKAIQLILKGNYSTEVIVFFSCFVMKPKQLFKSFFNELIDELKSQNLKDRNLSHAHLLTEVICATGSFDLVGDTFFNWATNKLDVQTYDDSILNAIARLSEFYGSERVAERLMTRFNNPNTSKRKQRRIVYYFSYAKHGFPIELIDCIQNLDIQDPEARHLTYHIMAALVDNYQLVGNEATDYLTGLQDYFGNDCILKSEYATLYKAIHNSQWMNAEGERICIEELIDMLSTGEYWEKAHAAGALSRYAYSSDEEASLTVRAVFRVLEQEFATLSDPIRANINHTRVVSYIAKSLYQIQQKVPSLKRNIQLRLVGLLEQYVKELNMQNICTSVYFSLQTALAVVLECILSLIDEKRDFYRSLGRYYTMDEPLLSTYADISLLEREALGQRGDNIENDIRILKENMNISTIKDNVLKDSPNGNWYATSRLSLVEIHCDSWVPTYGFLFAYKHSIYVVTCRHNFCNEKTNVFADVSNIEFSLGCCSKDICTGVLCYPEKIDYNCTFNDHANEDLAIFKLHNVPACLYKVVFSVDNLTIPQKGIAVHSIIFQEGNPINSEKMYSGTIDQLRGSGYFYIRLPIEKGGDTRGFSGTAVFGENAELYGIWKGTDSETSNKCCINAQILLKHLKNIEEGRSE